MTVWTRADRLPPILIRLLARRRSGPPLSDLEIAERSGLPLFTVATLSQCTSWEGVDLPTMRKFLAGCGLDFTQYRVWNRVMAYLKSPVGNFKYLRTHPLWKTHYEPLMLRWHRTLAQPTPPSRHPPQP